MLFDINIIFIAYLTGHYLVFSRQGSAEHREEKEDGIYAVL